MLGARSEQSKEGYKLAATMCTTSIQKVVFEITKSKHHILYMHTA